MQDNGGFLERFLLRSSFEARSIFGSIRRNTQRFENESNRILETVNNCDYDLLSRPTQLPRLLGMNASSCRWTAFMVLDYLRRYIEITADQIGSLVQGTSGMLADGDFFNIAPDDAGAKSIDEFQESAWRYSGFITNLQESGKFQQSTGSVTHAVYGMLSAKRLHCLAGHEMKIRRRQIKKILAHEGIV